MPESVFGPKRTVVKTVTVEVPTVVPDPETVDIDTLLYLGLRNISRMMGVISKEAALGTFNRESVQNLKDLMSLLEALKKRELDLLDKLSDAELEELSKK